MLDKLFIGAIALLALVAIVAILAAFAILFATKTGIRSWVAGHTRIKLLNEMLNCDFCFSFWTGVAISLVLSIATNCWWLMFMPIFSAPITRFLL